MKTKLLLLSTLACLAAGCEKFEYNPYQTELEDLPRSLNSVNIAKLKAAEERADDTVTILFTGDSQRFYASLEKLVDRCNGLEQVDMLILAGDISDFSLVQEFKWVTDELSRLRVPYLCVIGNHDLTANGGSIYESVFGAKNFSFTYKGIRFLFHDTNGREYNFNGQVPDVAWMSNQMEDVQSRFFVGVSHVAPFDRDFDPALEHPYKNLLASDPRYILSLHGHQHNGGDAYYYHDHVRYITSFSVGLDKCLLLKIHNGQVTTQTLQY